MDAKEILKYWNWIEKRFQPYGEYWELQDQSICYFMTDGELWNHYWNINYYALAD